MTDASKPEESHLSQTDSDGIADDQRAANYGRRHHNCEDHNQMRPAIKQNAAKDELNHFRIVISVH